MLSGGIIAVTFFLGFYKFYPTKSKEAVTEVKAINPKNLTYVVGGTPVQIINGKAEQEVAPGSASKETLALFGEPVYGDIDGDGDLDAVTYLTKQSGGSGTFYYVVVVANNKGTYKGTNALFLGDRIAPQNINFINGKAVANFAERKSGEPFTTAPSVGKSVVIQFDTVTGQIGELANNFEGEADPSRMTLSMKTWEWMSATDNTKKITTPRTQKKFMLTLKTGNTFSATTDCNGVGGAYKTSGSALSFDKMMSTMMFCDGAQEGEFMAILGDTESYQFTSKGELILKRKTGNAVFR